MPVTTAAGREECGIAENAGGPQPSQTRDPRTKDLRTRDPARWQRDNVESPETSSRRNSIQDTNLRAAGLEIEATCRKQVKGGIELVLLERRSARVSRRITGWCGVAFLGWAS